MPAAGGKLREVTLSPAAWSEFQTSLKDLAALRERHGGAFKSFVEYISRRNFSIFLDAANIAYYNTHKAGSSLHFDWLQVKQVYERARELYPDKRPMVVIHEARCGRKTHGCQEVSDFLERVQVRASTPVVTICCLVVYF